MVNRRAFLAATAASLAIPAVPPAHAADYRGPNVILIRFGGGVRRRETIMPETTYAPYMLNTLSRRGVLIPGMRIEQLDGVSTSHAEGTINILTGRYLGYVDRGSTLLEDRLEPTVPTLFDYLRRSFALAPHEALLVNGEDRLQEEYLVAGAMAHKGFSVSAEMLSLHRFKLHKFGRMLNDDKLGDEERSAAAASLADLVASSPYGSLAEPAPAIMRFWDRWRADFGDTGLVNPRGDRLLTEIALRAMAELRPRLMMINYQDPDYVHWGNASHYTRAIAVIDEGIQRIVTASENDEFYRGNTVFVIVPDCGRDANSLMDIPYQHHFNTRSAHDIWALVAGPGIVKGRTLDKPVDQSAIAATVGAIMGFGLPEAEGSALSEIFA